MIGGLLLTLVPIPATFEEVTAVTRGWQEPTLEAADYQFWVFSDPHNRRDGLEPIADAIRDLAGTGIAGRATVEWDIAIGAGDWVGLQVCPDDRDGALIRDQIVASGADPNRIYSAIGNHDADPGHWWFQNWIDPMGTRTATSGISNSLRPYPVAGTWDHYRFETDDFLFLVLGDRNGPGEPFGRDCSVPRGYPAGGYSVETYEWWVDQVEAASKPVITVAHHALHDTTAYTRMYEGADRGVHSGFTDADEMGSSFVFGIGDVGFPDRDYGFVHYLQQHPGAVAMWIHGHTHDGFTPGTTYMGNRDIEVRHGVVFLNAGAITTTHAAPQVPYSHIVQYFRDDRRLVITPFLHDNWGWTQPAGPYGKGRVTFHLDADLTELG